MLRSMVRILRDNGTHKGASKLISRAQGQRVVYLAAMHERVGWSQKSTCSWRNENTEMQLSDSKYLRRRNLSKRLIWIGSKYPVIQPTLPGSQSMHVSSMKLVVSAVGTGANMEGESSEMYEEEEIYLPERCPGCGVKLQLDDPDAPGYCHVPKKIINILTNAETDETFVEEAEEGVAFEEEEEQEETKDLADDDNPDFVKLQIDDPLFPFDRVDNDWDFDTIGQKRKKSEAEPRPDVFETEEDSDIFADLVCARCYSLKHYGKVKSQVAESALPDFDLGTNVGRTISLRQFRRSVVVAVVDLADFDGSLPRKAILSLLPQDEVRNKPSKMMAENFRFIVVANKADLLPKQATKARLEQWVRKRVEEGGLPRPSSVYIVSSHTQNGVRSLLVDIQKSVGSRGDAWVVGAQNAGKSSLLNAMRKSVGLKPSTVTAAHLPGTTLGMVNVSGLVPTGCKMLDTPGVRHEYQLTSLLMPEEVKMILPRRSLKPRTYRVGQDQTISIGGVARIDACSIPGATIYLTFWVSDDIRTHLGKTSSVESLYATHLGGKLSPPVCSGDDSSRLDMFPSLLPTDVEVEGIDWRSNSVDICIAGLGWIAVGVKGKASFKVWAPPGVAITTRSALIPDMAKEFCRPGFDTVLPQPRGKAKRTSKRN
eukprot:jgi/Picsp_1/2910/NSC_01135-R1_gtp binding protein